MFREENVIYDMGVGCYWSSSCSPYGGEGAGVLELSDFSIGLPGHDNFYGYRRNGYSVRLVQDTNNPGGEPSGK